MRSLTDLAGDLSISTEQVLTTLRIVASRAGVEELAGWAARELEGYEEDDELPEHRCWHLTIRATLYSPFRVIGDTHVGDLAIDEKYRERVTFHCCRAGIGRIEGLLASGESEMAVEHPNLARLINAGPIRRNGWECTHASATFSTGRLKTIVDRARQTALRLCLECEAKDVELRYEESSDPVPSQERSAWIELMKTETTRAVVRSAWEAARDLIFRRTSAVSGEQDS